MCRRAPVRPIVPAFVIGLLAVAILILNVNLPNVIEMLCSVAIVWANLAYLLVTLPLLLSRRRRREAAPSAPFGSNGFPRNGAVPAGERPYFSLGRWGLPVNVIAVVWGLFVVVNISWPRSEIYGEHPWGRFAAPLATLSLIAAGAAYYVLYQRKRSGIVPITLPGDSA